jgi:hypothetical protein
MTLKADPAPDPEAAVAQATLAADELLQDPEFVRLLAQWQRDVVPEHLLAPLRSLENEALQAAVSSGRYAGVDWVSTSSIQPAWVRLGLLNELLSWLAVARPACIPRHRAGRSPCWPPPGNQASWSACNANSYSLPARR